MAPLNSVRTDALAAHATPKTALSKRAPGTILWSRFVIVAITFLIVAGFGLRLNGLGQLGFAEDEINKLVAVRSYDRGDFSANAEHPILMKALMDVSMRGARGRRRASRTRVAQ